MHPSPGGVAQWVERVLYHSTRRAVPERSENLRIQENYNGTAGGWWQSTVVKP
jgi:hypothetical protein